MNYYIIVFKNTHDAMTADKKLAMKNYKFRIMPTPTLITQSCGICVRIENDDEINSIIENKEIEFKNIYKRNETEYIYFYRFLATVQKCMHLQTGFIQAGSCLNFLLKK